MKKTLLSLVLVPILFGSCLSPSPNNLVSIPSQLTQDQLVCSYNRKLTAAHYTLEMEKDLGASQHDIQKIDNFLERTQKKIILKGRYTREDATNILSTINQEIKSLFSVYEPGDVFYTALRTGKADCERYAIPYISVAQSLDLPMTAMYASGRKVVNPEGKTNWVSHVFIRWKFSNKTNDWISYECTSGKIEHDNYFSKYSNIKEIQDFNRWCIETRLLWCPNQYGTNLPAATRKAEKLIRSLN